MVSVTDDWICCWDQEQGYPIFLSFYVILLCFSEIMPFYLPEVGLELVILE